VQLRTSGLSRSDSARYSSVVFRSECPSHFLRSRSDAPSRCRDVAKVLRLCFMKHSPNYATSRTMPPQVDFHRNYKGSGAQSET
jgi:hypothetical protein